MGHICSRSTRLLALLAGYLLGSIPFGLLLTQAAGLGDVRNIGSGNIGATNVLRTGRKGLAAATLLLDLLKGTVAVLLVYDIARALRSRFDAYQLLPISPGSAPSSATSFPVWLRFQGGKGVATYIGVLIGMHWPAALCSAWSGPAWRWHALFLAGRAVRRPSAVVLYYLRHRLGRAAVHPDHVRADLPQAPRQHPPPARRRGEQDWRPVMSMPHAADAGAAAASAARRRPAPGLPAPDPQRQRRPRHLPRAHQSLRRRRAGAGRPARAVARAAAAGRRIRICPREQAEAELEAAARIGAQPLFTIEPGYPPALAAVDAPPPLLYVKGNAGHLTRPMVAIVGARNGSAAGPEARPPVRLASRRCGLRHRLGPRARHRRGRARGGARRPAPSPCWPAASTTSIRRRTPSLQRADRRARLPGQREPAGLRAARPGLPAPQPHHLRPLAGRADRRGGAALRHADHRPHGRRAGPRGVRRSRPPPRPARGRHQRACIKTGATMVTEPEDVLERAGADAARGPRPGRSGAAPSPRSRRDRRQRCRSSRQTPGRRPRTAAGGAGTCPDRHRRAWPGHRPAGPRHPDRPARAGAGRAHRAPRPPAGLARERVRPEAARACLRRASSEASQRPASAACAMP